MSEPIEVVFGGRRLLYSRYCGNRTLDNGNKMILLFDEPREAVTVVGQDNIEAAKMELDWAFEQTLGGGWVDIR